jgi:hypothetical protein
MMEVDIKQRQQDCSSKSLYIFVLLGHIPNDKILIEDIKFLYNVMKSIYSKIESHFRDRPIYETLGLIEDINKANYSEYVVKVKLLLTLLIKEELTSTYTSELINELFAMCIKYVYNERCAARVNLTDKSSIEIKAALTNERFHIFFNKSFKEGLDLLDDIHKSHLYKQLTPQQQDIYDDNLFIHKKYINMLIMLGFTGMKSTVIRSDMNPKINDVLNEYLEDCNRLCKLIGSSLIDKSRAEKWNFKLLTSSFQPKMFDFYGVYPTRLTRLNNKDREVWYLKTNWDKNFTPNEPTTEKIISIMVIPTSKKYDSNH